ncbi:MAG: hypothetical protein U0572_11730 [Phycisphaerales bacterium]
MLPCIPTVAVVALHIAYPPAPPVMADRVRDAITTCVPKLVAMQESLGGAADAPKAEWPYEGVYRVGGKIPYGYRVGGTSIVAQVLLESDGYAKDAERKTAVARACDFVCAAIDEPLMSPDPKVYKGGYDVRGWGHCYGLRFLLALERAKAVPEGRDERVRRAIDWYLHALQSTEIPSAGGWNYARRPGLETPCPSSPFMTAPGVMALVEAKASGRTIDEGVLARAITALENARTESGYVDYSAAKPARDRPDQIPGAIGRMVATESALFLVGRSNSDRLQFALDSFLRHWQALEARRKQQGTHEPPYMVAPYYFFYGFHHAALAIELLPPTLRENYRAKLVDLFFQVRDADGTWNDRVFPRSANFGTAMSISALAMPWGPRPTGLASTAGKHDA